MKHVTAGRVVAAVAPIVAWWQITAYAPEWPPLWVAGGAAAVLFGCVAAHGGTYGRGVALTIPAGVAAVATAGWALAHQVMNPPVEWFTRGGVFVSTVWVVGLLVFVLSGGYPKPPRAGRVTPLRRALAASGISALGLPEDGKFDPVRVSKPQRVGLGDRHVVQLPAGTTAASLAGRIDALAGALTRAVTDIDVSVGSHASEAVVWVGDKGAGAQQAGQWPGVRDRSERSCFDPFSIGLNKYGEDIEIELHGGSGVLIGALPGQGKSALMNLIVSAVLADPRPTVWCLDFKGGGDFTQWERVAAEFYSGAPSTNPGEVLRILRAFRDDMDSKFARLKECRASKITDELADEPGMEPSLLWVDEAQDLLAKTSDVSATEREEATAIIKQIVARGRAVNAWVLIAGQRVTDDEIPAAITQRVTNRVAFRLGTQPASQAVLGPDAWARGYRATECPNKGIGLLATDTGIERLRAWYVSDEDAHELASRVQARRRAAADPTPTPPLALTAAETATLARIEAVEFPRARSWDDVVRDVTNRSELAAQNRALQQLEEAELAARADRSRTADRAGVEELVALVERAWPAGQRGPLRSVWLSALADAAGVDDSWLAGELAAAGAPVEQVRMTVDGGSKRWGAGLTRDGFNGWAHPHERG